MSTTKLPCPQVPAHLHPRPTKQEAPALAALEALLAGTLALMGCMSRSDIPDAHRRAMVCKVRGNLSQLAKHPLWSAAMVTVLQRVQAQWPAFDEHNAVNAQACSVHTAQPHPTLQ